MSKKQKKVKAKPPPTKHQLSKWQRQKRKNRITVIVAAVFLAGILGYVGFGYYNNAIKPFQETVISVNDTSYNMGYYVDMLDVQTQGMQPNESYAQFVASQIEESELMRQGANELGIRVEKEEVDEKIKENSLPDSKVYQDIVSAGLLSEKLLDYFGSKVPDKMVQAYVKTMLVESQEVADNVTSQLEAGGNFTALLNELSYDPSAGGDLGWLPTELMPSIIAEIIPDIEQREVRVIYDDSVTKNLGYWLIKVTERDEEKGIYAHAMLLGSEEEARKVKDELNVGGNFTQLAEQYSQDVSKDDGGDLGWLKEGDIHSEAFDEVAFTLELNEVSEPVKGRRQTQGAYQVVIVLGKEERDISEEVKQSLISRDFNDWLSAQREISIIDNRLDEEKMIWAIQQVLERR